MRAAARLACGLAVGSIDFHGMGQAAAWLERARRLLAGIVPALRSAWLSLLPALRDEAGGDHRGADPGFLVLVPLLAGASPTPAGDPAEALLRSRGEAFVAAMNAQGDAVAAFARDHLETRVVREGLTPRFAERMKADHAELGPVKRHTVQVLNDGRHARSSRRSA